MALVDVQNLAKSYTRRTGLKNEEQFVVEDVSFTIQEGETLGLVGESGSGKSTIARMILGLVKPTRGNVLVDAIDVAQAGGRQMRNLRRQMQPVFQDPFAALNPRMKVSEIIAEPLIIHRNQPGVKASKEDLRRQTNDMLRAVGLDESALGRYPHEFSGGQRQRINIARALMLRPKLLILDEPVSALDVSVGAQIINLLRQLQNDFRLTYLFISHSMPLVRYLSTNIAVLQQGKLVEQAPAEELCAHPRQQYTQALLAATPELNYSPTPKTS
jgi:ABC-type oligopeptide transport system ATPase subunit